MDQLDLLFLLSFSMLIGSFISGMVPMAFKLSDSKSRLLALMGSGILIGTALSIIIPEGIDSMYMQPEALMLHSKPESQTTQPSSSSHHEQGQHDDTPTLSPSQSSPPPPPVQTATIGVSLVAGFVLMLFIDQFSLYQSGGDHQHGHDHERHSSQNERHDYIMANQQDEGDEDDDDDEEIVVYGNDLVEEVKITNENSEKKPIKNADPDFKIMMQTFADHPNDPSQDNLVSHKIHDNLSHNGPSNNYKTTSRSLRRANRTKVTPTLGLVIHAAADGIALGAAATTSHRHVEMIIFLAIMLHKAPAAFSLVVFLLHRGLKHSTIRQHLLAFSLSAPFAALLTYFGLSQSGKEALRRNNATGIAMLFSAGTFLYVATVHVLPELVHNQLLSPKEMLFLVGGAFLPILLAQTV